MPRSKTIKKKENQMIEFILEPSPMIKLGEIGDLVFSKITSHPQKGFKYICLRKDSVDVIVVKKNGERKVIEYPNHNSWVVNMQLERKTKSTTQKSLGLPHKAMPGRMKDFIKKTFAPFIDDEGYISYEDLPRLKRKLNGKSITKILNTVQKPRKKRKKKSG